MNCEENYDDHRTINTRFDNQSSEKYWLRKNTGSACQKPVFT
jgi:hypothetical protein